MTHAEVRKRLGQRASRAKHVGSSVDDGDASSARDARHHAAVRPLLGRRQRALHLHLRVWWQHPPRRGEDNLAPRRRVLGVSFFLEGPRGGHRRRVSEDEVRVSRDAALKQTEIQGRLREHHLRALHLRGDAHEEFRSVFADADERSIAPRRVVGDEFHHARRRLPRRDRPGRRVHQHRLRPPRLSRLAREQIILPAPSERARGVAPVGESNLAIVVSPGEERAGEIDEVRVDDDVARAPGASHQHGFHLDGSFEHRRAVEWFSRWERAIHEEFESSFVRRHLARRERRDEFRLGARRQRPRRGRDDKHTLLGRVFPFER